MTSRGPCWRNALPGAMLVAAVTMLTPACSEERREYVYMADFSRAFIRLLQTRDPSLREEVTAAVVAASTRRGSLLPVVKPLQGERILAVGLTIDYWTVGNDLAAILVSNPGSEPQRPVFRLICNTGKESSSRPMTVYIDDGDEKPRALVFARTEERTVTFSSVPPGSRKLYVITTDRTQVPDSPNDKRQLGVRIIVDHQWLLRDLARTRGAGQKRRDLRHVIEHHVQDKVTMLGGFMAALGLGWNGFTEGKDAAAVVVSNPGKDKMTPRIRLSSLARPQDMPVTVKVEGGEWHESVQFNQPGEQHLSLPAVLPGGIRLFTFTVSKPWNHPRAASRLLGVKLDVTTPGLLEMLRGSRGPGLHGAAAATLVRERSQDLRKLGDGGAQLGGVTNDGWTSGGKPGAVVISNRSYKTAWWELTLGCDAGAASLPITALVDDGEKPITARFLKAGDQRVVLSPIAPYSRKLYLITTDQSWTPTGGTDRRLLGVRITSARQIVKGAAKE